MEKPYAVIVGNWDGLPASTAHDHVPILIPGRSGPADRSASRLPLGATAGFSLHLIERDCSARSHETALRPAAEIV
jgi:hypothetical protein